MNHAGSRTFSINLLEDELVRKAICDRAEEMIYAYQ